MIDSVISSFADLTLTKPDLMAARSEAQKIKYEDTFYMGIRWHIYVTEQVMKSVSQIEQVNNLPSILCVQQSLIN